MLSFVDSEMELTDHIFFIDKTLIRTDFACEQALRSFRQAELLPVPMEHDQFLRQFA